MHSSSLKKHVERGPERALRHEPKHPTTALH